MECRFKGGWMFTSFFGFLFLFSFLSGCFSLPLLFQKFLAHTGTDRGRRSIPLFISFVSFVSLNHLAIHASFRSLISPFPILHICSKRITRIRLSSPVCTPHYSYFPPCSAALVPSSSSSSPSALRPSGFRFFPSPLSPLRFLLISTLSRGLRIISFKS